MKHLPTKFQPNRVIRSGVMMDFDFLNHGLKKIEKHQIFFINLDVPNGYIHVLESAESNGINIT